MTLCSQRITALAVIFAFVLSSGPALAANFEGARKERPHFVLAADKLDLEDDHGYSSEYIFGMTKGVMRSTLEPALKPAVLIVTVPLDLAFLPFAAIGGFFR